MSRSGKARLPPFVEAYAKVIERGAVRVEALTVRPIHPNNLRREVQHLPELGFLLPEQGFGTPLLAKVGHCTHEFEVPRRILKCLGQGADMLDRSAGQKQTILVLEVGPGFGRALNDFLLRRTVLGMYALYHQIQSRLLGAIVLEDTVGFVGPENLPIGNLPAEAARLAQPLRLRQVHFAPAELLRQQFVFGNVNGATHVALELLVSKRGSTNAANVSDLTIGTHDALGDIQGRSLGQDSIDVFGHGRTILRA